jgi:hypothetical protein
MSAASRPGLVFAAGLCLILAAVAAIGLWHERGLARALVEDDMRDLRAAHRLIEDRHRRETRLLAGTIAGNQAVTGYIAQALDSVLPGMEPDYASVVDLIEERRTQLRLSLVAILGADGSLLAATDPITGTPDFAEVRAFREARDTGRAGGGLLIEGERLMYMQILPLAEYGFNEIYLLVASPLDDAFAADIAAAFGGDKGHGVVILREGPAGPRVFASSLQPRAVQSVAAAMAGRGALAATFGEGVPLSIGGEGRFAASSPLFGDAGTRVLLLVPEGGATAPRDAARLPLLAGCMLALAIAGLAALWFLRRWLRPWRDLHRVMSHAADHGDLRMRAQVEGAGAMAPLADAFNRLCARALAAIARD